MGCNRKSRSTVKPITAISKGGNNTETNKGNVEKGSNDVLPNATKNGSTSSGTKQQNLSKAEWKVITLIQQGITGRVGLKVAYGCGIKNIDKNLTLLRKRGIISVDNQLVAGWEQLGGTMLPAGGVGCSPMQANAGSGAVKSKRFMRVHGQQFWIELSEADLRASNGRYKPKGGDVPIWVDGERVLTHNRAIEIYSKRQFIGQDKNDATKVSLDYWFPFIARLQNTVSITIIRNGKQNVHLVKQHIGYVGDPLAKDIVESGKKYHVHGYDGKLRLIIDNSNGIPEIEAINPGDTDADMKRCEKQQKDWIENDPRTSTEIDQTANEGSITATEAMRLIWEQSHINKEQAEIIRDTVANVNSLSTFLVTMLPKKEEPVRTETKKIDRDVMYG